jgi:predicted nuclease with TOPRIM domain
MFNRNSSYQNHINHLQNIIVNYEKQITLLNASLQKQNNSEMELQDKMNQLSETNLSLQQQKENSEMELQDKMNQISLLEEQKSQLEQQNTDLIIEFTKQSSRLQQLEPEHEEMKCILSNLKQENNMLREKLKE